MRLFGVPVAEVELRILNLTGTLNRQPEPATGTSNIRNLEQ